MQTWAGSGPVMICLAPPVGGVSCIYTTSPDLPASPFGHDACTRAFGGGWFFPGDGLCGFCKSVLLYMK